MLSKYVNRKNSWYGGSGNLGADGGGPTGKIKRLPKTGFILEDYIRITKSSINSALFLFCFYLEYLFEA